MFINVPPPRPQGRLKCQPGLYHQTQQPFPVTGRPPHQLYASVDFGSKCSLETHLLAQLFSHQHLADTQHNMTNMRNEPPWLKPEPVLNVRWGIGDVAEDQSFLLDDHNSYRLPASAHHPPARHNPAVSLHTSSSRNDTNTNPSRSLGAQNCPIRSIQHESAYWPTVPPSLSAGGPFVPTPEHHFDATFTLNGLPSYDPQASFHHPVDANSLLLPLLPPSSPLSPFSSFSSTGASELIDSMMLNETDQSPLPVSSSTSNHITGVASMPGQQAGGWGATSQAMETTVSPKLLKLRPSPTPNSSTESFHTSFFTGVSQEGSSFSTAEYDSDPVMVPLRPSPSTNFPTLKPKPRKQLPDKPRSVALQPKAENPLSSLPKSSRSSKESKHKTKSPVPLQSQAPALPSMTIPHSERSTKDDFLVRSKRAGMTYKEIRRKGGFTEAESTLRGRYRTLTKNKEARVRKPEWSERDLYLLEQAVRNLARGDDLRSAKIPWKQVAEQIYSDGGSYLFGNSTCRKRWDDLVAEEESRGGDISVAFFHTEDEAGEDGEGSY